MGSGSLHIGYKPGVQRGTWKKGEDPKVSRRFLRGNRLALIVHYNCHRMVVEGSLMYGKSKGLGDL